MTTGTTVRIPRWLAFDQTGKAHAFVGRSQVALCGAARQDDRYTWPKRWNCPECAAVEAARR